MIRLMDKDVISLKFHVVLKMFHALQVFSLIYVIGLSIAQLFFISTPSPYWCRARPAIGTDLELGALGSLARGLLGGCCSGGRCSPSLGCR